MRVLVVGPRQAGEDRAAQLLLVEIPLYTIVGLLAGRAVIAFGEGGEIVDGIVGDGECRNLMLIEEGEEARRVLRVVELIHGRAT